MAEKRALRAAIYARYSSDLQRDTSIEDQVRRCREAIEERGWRVSSEEHIFVDRAVSGAITNSRPGYQRLLEAIREKAFDVLVVDDLSRLSRDQGEAHGLRKRLSFRGIWLVALNDGLDTGTNEKSANLIAGVKGVLNEEFLRDLAEKTHRGQVGQVKRGFSAGGFPYGYRSVPVYDDPPKLDRYEQPVAVGYRREIVSEEAAVVGQIFRAYAGGMSARGIANMLNREGVPSPGTRWRSALRHGRGWATGTILGTPKRSLGLLNNTTYVGRVIWNKFRYLKDPDTERRVGQARPEAEWVTEEHPELRIVPQVLWDRVKHVQGKRSPAAGERAAANVGNRYLLSGLLRCGICGATLIRTGAAGYSCSTHRRRGKDLCTFSSTPNRFALEVAVLHAVTTRLFRPEAVEEAVRAATQDLKRRFGEAKATSRNDAGAQRVKALDAEIANLLAAIRAGGNNVAAGLLRKELDRAVAERDRLAGAGRNGEGLPDEKTLERALAEVPQAVGRIFEEIETALTDPQFVAPAREALADLVGPITVTPTTTGEGLCYRIAIEGDYSALLRLAAHNGKSVTGIKSASPLRDRSPSSRDQCTRRSPESRAPGRRTAGG